MDTEPHIFVKIGLLMSWRARGIVPPNPSERFEGIDFSGSGRIMAIATSETNSVLLFQRKPDGRFEDAHRGEPFAKRLASKSLA